MAESTTLPRTVTLSSGHVMPTVGLGTYGLTDGVKLQGLIDHALKTSGYRFLDCATKYGNEEHVGTAIQSVFAEG